MNGERWIPSMLDRLTIFLEEQMIVIDFSGASHLVAQCELAIKDLQRPRARGNPSIFASFRGIPVDAGHTRLVDTKGTPRGVEVCDRQRNLFGGAHAGEKSELVVVALRFTPLVMDCGDQRLGVLNPEWIGDGPVFPAHADALQPTRRVEFVGVI
jgi:hypothetical protein